MENGYFITGTSTGVGKTLVSCALLHAFAARDQAVVGMKPVAAGCENGKWMDVELLAAASSVTAPRGQMNPYPLIPLVAPHIAAYQTGRSGSCTKTKPGPDSPPFSQKQSIGPPNGRKTALGREIRC